jgi:hypothetical protein
MTLISYFDFILGFKCYAQRDMRRFIGIGC